MSPADPFRYFRLEAREIVEDLGRGILELERDGGAAVATRLLRLAHTLKGAARVVKHLAIAEHAHAVEEVLAPLRTPGTKLGPEAASEALRIADAIRREVERLEGGAPFRGIADVEPEAPGRVPHPQPAEEAPRAVRAEIADVDALVEGITEATIQIASLKTIASGLRLSEELLTRVEGVERELEQVRDAAERLRLLPAETLFSALERTARDAAREVDKRVVFRGTGGHLRLDADVLGVVQGALVQIVRNAVAHGIERESERLALRKPVPGSIEVAVRRRGDQVVFDCRDDGRGIDHDAVRQAATRSGALAPGVEASSEELLGLLLRGGLSTSRTVTEVAGRGIGLDVVRDAMSRLGGKVELQTEAGRGLAVRLVVPLSLSAFDALVVETGVGAAVAIPLDAVRRTLRVAANDVVRTPTGDTIVDEGEVIPFVPLGRLLRFASPTGPGPAALPAVVVAGSGARAALSVERLVGRAAVVVRRLPAAAPALAVVAGASIDSEGNPRLVLDPDVLVTEARGAPVAARAPEARPALPILVVDDSLTTRMLEQSILESAGYEVDVASSAEEGLARVRGRTYALCLVDVEMPGMDGFGFVETTQRDPELRRLPCILVTSRNAPEDRQRAVEVGASAYVVKSEFDQAALLELIRLRVDAPLRGIADVDAPPEAGGAPLRGIADVDARDPPERRLGR